MSSLSQLRASHGPALLLDAASSRIQIGWLPQAGSPTWSSSEEDAGTGVFRCLDSLGVKIDDVSCFIFCDGPGSILGIRTVAMAIRAWQMLDPRPAFSYNSLQLLAHTLKRAQATVIADARRDSWHAYRLGDALRRVPTAQLSGELVTPSNFRHWSTLPSQVHRVDYSVATLLPIVDDEDLFAPADRPDAFLHEEPSYATWAPQVHRAPVRS